MKRLLTVVLLVATLAGCGTSSIIGPNSRTLSQGLTLHDIFDDPTQFEYAYDRYSDEDSDYDYYSITLGGATIDDFTLAMNAVKDAGFTENAAYDGMTEVFSYVGYKDGYQCYMCLVYGMFEMTIRPENYQELSEQHMKDTENK